MRVRDTCRLLLCVTLILGSLLTSARAQENTQSAIPPGTKITMQNWQQYRQFMPDGMAVLFEGKYFWKMLADVEMNVGPTHNYPMPPGYAAMTEKYGNQTQVVPLPDGTFDLKNYVGGLPFPNPAEPYKGWKILANQRFGTVTGRILAATPETGLFTGCVQDHFYNISCGKNLVVFRRLGFISQPGYPNSESEAPGAFASQFIMVWQPENFKYLTDFTIFYQDIKREEDNYIFAPALRRTLRVSTFARCSPLLGSDYTKDDARSGFNGRISIFQAQFLRDQKILALTELTTEDGLFPENWEMPLGWAKPSWGSWTVRDAWVIDVRRVPMLAPGYCYGKRIMYVDKEIVKDVWDDLYDHNMKLWKVLSNELGMRPSHAAGGEVIARTAAQMWDLQNDHATYGRSAGPDGRDLVIDDQVPGQYDDIPKYSSPGGLMAIMR